MLPERQLIFEGKTEHLGHEELLSKYFVDVDVILNFKKKETDIPLKLIPKEDVTIDWTDALTCC